MLNLVQHPPETTPTPRRLPKRLDDHCSRPSAWLNGCRNRFWITSLRY